MERSEMTKSGAFLDALRAGGLVFDGAMGTSLYEQGILYTRCFDELNVSEPGAIHTVHEAYVGAGAQVLETNTFGANRVRLAHHGFAARVAEINAAGVAVARRAAAGRAFVVGSVGPTGLMLETVPAARHHELADAFHEQCASLVQAGVDGLVLETFRQPEELELAVSAAHAASAGVVPVIASVSFDDAGTTADGRQPEQVAELLAGLEVAAIGVNCATGPARGYEMVTRMAGPGRPLVAIPNAGLPQRIEGRLAYMATPEYFQIYSRRLFKADVHAVGGCCGTTPEHVRKIVAAARMVSGGHPVAEVAGAGMREESPAPSAEVAPGVTVVATADKGEIGRKLGTRFVVSVEVNPPPGL